MDSPFLGMIQYFGFNFAPKGYLTCNGALLSIQQNSALFALLGTMYGGNGTTTFGLPDLQGRAIQGWSNSNTLGEKMGTESTTMLVQNMPMHTHTVPAIPIASNTGAGRQPGGNTNDPTANYPSSPSAGNLYMTTTDNTNLATPSVTIGSVGGNQPFSTLNPYLALTCCIATVGLFPSRN